MALGFPHVVTLGQDVDDPEAYAKARLACPLRRLEPWPSNAATRAARALFWGWNDFPDDFLPEALDALANDTPLDPAELPELFGAYFQVPTSAWDHFFELLFLLEAVLGGVAVLDAVLPVILEDPQEWLVVEGTRRSFVLGLGMILDRLSEEAGAPAAERLRELLARYEEDKGELAWSPELVGVPLRSIDLILNGARGYERSARRFEGGPDRGFDSLFLDRASFARATKQTGPLPPHAAPSVQWLVQGGEGEVPSLLDWDARTFKGSKEVAQRHLVGEWSRAPFAGSAELLADVFARGIAKEDVLAAVRPRIGAFRPLLETAARDATDAVIRGGASALLSKLLPS